ncbi:MAG: cytochrome c [Bacteroidota bacterium]
MKKIIVNLFFISLLAMVSCGGNSSENSSTSEKNSNVKGANNDPAYDIGIGTIEVVTLGEINVEQAAKGKELYKINCTACHKFKKRYVGPAMLGVTQRRTPEWVMNMIINPELMLKENDAAKALFAEYLAPMANQNINENDARAIFEYLRQIDLNKK